jgi:hypothetical protein
MLKAGAMTQRQWPRFTGIWITTRSRRASLTIPRMRTSICRRASTTRPSRLGGDRFRGHPTTRRTRPQRQPARRTFQRGIGLFTGMPRAVEAAHPQREQRLRWADLILECHHETIMSNNRGEQGNMKTFHAIIVGLVIGFLAGVGTMQASLIGDVRDHTTKIAHIEKDFVAEQSQVDRRLDNIARLMESMLETNRELIVLLNNKNKP